MWRLEGNLAQWESDSLHASVDVTSPCHGLHAIVWRAVALEDTRLANVHQVAEASGTVLAMRDCFVRQNDLVATYDTSSVAPLRCQVRWRITSRPAPTNRVTFDTLVSVETENLECDPRICVTNRLPGNAWWRLESGKGATHGERIEIPGCSSIDLPIGSSWPVLLFHYDGLPVSFAQILDPTGVLNISLRAEHGGTTSRAELFPPPLEKGVILQARLRGVLMVRDEETRIAFDQREELRQMAPPLAR